MWNIYVLFKSIACKWFAEMVDLPTFNDLPNSLSIRVENLIMLAIWTFLVDPNVLSFKSKSFLNHQNQYSHVSTDEAGPE